MALPNPPTSPDASKLFPLVYDNTGTNAAAVSKAARTETMNSEVVAHTAVATHKDTDTYASGDAVVVAAGVNGTNILPLAVNSDGEVGIHDGGNSITVDGTVSVSGTVTVATHAVTQSGTWNVGLNAGTNNIGDVDVLSIAAGTNTIGATLDAGWDIAGRAVQRGLAQGVTATTEQTLLAADASNLYNITDILFSYYSGSTAPAAFRTVHFKLGASGTVFHTLYIPPTANVTGQESITIKLPVRSTTNQAIVCQLSGALGTSGEYSACVLAYKTAS